MKFRVLLQKYSRVFKEVCGFASMYLIHFFYTNFQASSNGECVVAHKKNHLWFLNQIQSSEERCLFFR